MRTIFTPGRWVSKPGNMEGEEIWGEDGKSGFEHRPRSRSLRGIRVEGCPAFGNTSILDCGWKEWKASRA